MHIYDGKSPPIGADTQNYIYGGNSKSSFYKKNLSKNHIYGGFWKIDSRGFSKTYICPNIYMVVNHCTRGLVMTSCGVLESRNERSSPGHEACEFWASNSSWRRRYPRLKGDRRNRNLLYPNFSGSPDCLDHRLIYINSSIDLYGAGARCQW